LEPEVIHLITHFFLGLVVTMLLQQMYHVPWLNERFWYVSAIVYFLYGFIFWKVSPIKIAFTIGLAIPIACSLSADFDFLVRSVDRNMWPIESLLFLGIGIPLLLVGMAVGKELFREQ
jgi:hypothetical protein